PDRLTSLLGLLLAEGMQNSGQGPFRAPSKISRGICTPVVSALCSRKRVTGTPERGDRGPRTSPPVPPTQQGVARRVLDPPLTAAAAPPAPPPTPRTAPPPAHAPPPPPPRPPPPRAGPPPRPPPGPPPPPPPRRLRGARAEGGGRQGHRVRGPPLRDRRGGG